ncbi:MAG: hypothetical protein E6K08_05075 [Methanobacteriota archaeon]|nr:MAG: hypothetical protein E6K08_05075 [Euryarchaeota archaeon]
MGLLRDWHYIGKAVEIPALSEVIRESLIRALFVRDDRVLPKDLIADLNRLPPVTVKVKDDSEVRKLVRVLNGEESTVSLGLSAEDYQSSFPRKPIGPLRRSAPRGSSCTTPRRRRATASPSCRRSRSISRWATDSTAMPHSARTGAISVRT